LARLILSFQFGKTDHRSIGEAVANPTLSEATVERLSQIIEDLRAVPVNVEIKVVPVQESGAPSPVSVDELPVDFETRVEQGGGG